MEWNSFAQHLRAFSAPDRVKIEKAFELGQKAHAGQTRKSGEPYFTHPIAVAEYLIGIGADTETVIAALLHDTIEDTNVTLDEIHEKFGPIVAQLINGLTKLSERDVANVVTLDQKIETLRKIFTLMQQEDVRIMVIKLADRLHNMQTISFRSQEKQKKVSTETLDIYVKIADRLCMRELRDELEILCYDVLEPEVASELRIIREKNRHLTEEKAIIMKQTLSEHFGNIPISLMPEDKSWQGLRMQYEMSKEGPSQNRALNMIFLCDHIDECYGILGMLHQCWKREILSFDDFISAPIINGYKGLQTTVILNDGMRIRCKIRTRDMDRYARFGVATLCFDSKPMGLLDYLPWAQHISPLSEDTKKRSDEFWETLQTDILSESILIYGASGQTMLIPKGATALDGALYLFGEHALNLSSVIVNGKPAPLSQPLAHASTVEIVTGRESSVKLDWLYWAKTGFGIALIRSALSTREQSDANEIGKMLMQEALKERRLGYIEEFNPGVIEAIFRNIGYENLDEGYAAVANGHVQASSIVSLILNEANPKKKKMNSGELCSFVFSIDKDVESLSKLLSVYAAYNVNTNNVHMRIGNSRQLRMRLDMKLTRDEQHAMVQALVSVGAEHIVRKVSARSSVALMSVVVFCWALNPVWAKYFFGYGITPLELVSLRSIVFLVLTSLSFLIWRQMRRSPFSPIQHAFKHAFVPSVASFVHAFMIYLSISHLPPSIHLTVLRFNILLLPIIHLLQKKSLKLKTLLSSTALFASSIVLLMFSSKGISALGIAYAATSLGTYVFYSLSTENTLQRHKIGLRYPYFLLNMGWIVGLMGIALLPIIYHSINIWGQWIVPIVFYAFICVFIPHICFHKVLGRVQFRNVTSLSLFEVPLAIALEISLLGIILEPWTYGIVAVLLLIFGLFVWKRGFEIVAD